MGNKNKMGAIVSTPDVQCPSCGSHSVQYRDVKQTFEYGSEPNATSLEAVVPVGECSVCEFEFTDDRAEDIRHEAVCKFLGVMSPADIVTLRRRLGISQRKLAALTRLGQASIARWETGAIVQNGANDQLLYLLNFPGNISRLEKRGTPENTCEEDAPVAQRTPGRFRCIQGNEPEIAERAKSFSLRITGT